jgi:hypothetical protein
MSADKAAVTESDALADAIIDRVADRVTAIIENVAHRFAVKALLGDDAVLSRKDAGIALNLATRTLEAYAPDGRGPRETQIGASRGVTVGAIREYSKKHQTPGRQPKIFQEDV